MALQLNYTDNIMGSTTTDAYHKINQVKLDMTYMYVEISVYADLTARNDSAIPGITFVERVDNQWPINETDIMAYAYARLKTLAEYSTALDV